MLTFAPRAIFMLSSQAFSNCSSQQLLEIKNHMHMTKRLSALFAAALLGAVGCSGGSKGATGPAGPPGGSGGVGPGGMGSITVHVTFDKVNSTTLSAPVNAPGVYCFTNPDFTGNTTDTVADAVSDTSGNAVLSVPGGTYKIQCRPSAPGVAADYLDNMPLTGDIGVAAGGSVTVEVTATRTNPLYFTTPPSVAKTAILGTGTVVVGATSVPAATFTVAPVASKSVVDVVVDPSAHTFTLPDVDGVLGQLSATYDTSTDPATRTPGRGIWGAFELPQSAGFVSLGDGVARSLAKGLAFDVTATDGTNTTKVRAYGAIGGLQDIQGGNSPASATFGVTNGVAPVGVMVIASDVAAASYSWTLTAADKNGPLTPPTLNGATTRNPYFTPVTEGVYTLTNTVPTVPTVLKLTAAKYSGLLAADGSSGACAQCHDGPDSYVVKYLGYKNTADYFFHAMGVHGNTNYFSNPASRATEAAGAETIFQWGLQGVDYAPTCYKCHTTGSFYTNSGGADATVDNNGFQARLDAVDAAAKLLDPKAASLSSQWTGDGVDHYTGLDGGLKALGGIQCESCHGPASQHMALGGQDITTGEVKGLVIPWAVGACAVCHDAPGHHDKVELWSQSGHANANLAVAEGAGSASCARCHGAQGFAKYVSQQAGLGADCSSYQDSKGAAIALNTDGTLPNHNLPYADNLYVHVGVADVNGKFVCKQMAAADLANIGITAATVQPQTCQACHDAHSTELRIDGDTGALAAGFSVQGAGAGALCMTCHNGRNGPRGDTITPPTAGIAAPHTPTQAEILMGRNFYWVNGVTSPHAAVGETCVGCHVQLHPDSVVTGNNNHTFKADGTICKSCHGASTSPDALFGQWADGTAKLKAAMVAALGSSFQLIGTGTQSPVTVQASNVAITGYGRSGITFAFTTPVNDPNAASGTIGTITVALTNLKDVNGTTLTLTGRMAKAGWNLAMLSDQSSAVHNPLLVPQVFTVSSQKVLDTTAGAL
jgi:hypothetical protein